jgi:hypothetical protein
VITLTGKGVCFAHGPYDNPAGSCPRWPDCITDPQLPEYLAMRSKPVSLHSADMYDVFERLAKIWEDPTKYDPTPHPWWF